MESIRDNDKEWLNGSAKQITFIVTKDCQLACKYCYLVGKNEKERMSFEVAKKTIDYILSHKIYLMTKQLYGILLVESLFLKLI